MKKIEASDDGKIRYRAVLVQDGQDFQIEIRVDLLKIASILGRQARKNKCKVAIEAGGLVEVRVV